MASFGVLAPLAAGWRAFKARPMLWIKVELLIAVPLATPMFALGVQTTGSVGWWVWFLIVLAVLVLAVPVAAQLAVGRMYMWLKAIDGEPPRLQDLLAKPHLRWRAVYAYAVFLAAVAIGLLLLVIPGLYVIVRWGFWLFLMVDRDLSVGDAFAASSRLTAGHRWRLLVFLAVTVAWLFAFSFAVASVLGIGSGIFGASVQRAGTRLVDALLTCVYAPPLWLAWTWVYRRLAALNPQATLPPPAATA